MHELDAPAPILEPELPSPAWSAELQSPAPSWEEAPTTELAAVPAWAADAEPAAAQAWAESAAEEPAVAQTWAESAAEEPAPAPAWEESFEVYAPLANEVYADELKQTKEDPDTIVLERTTERAPGERGGVSRTRAGAVYVHVTGF